MLTFRFNRDDIETGIETRIGVESARAIDVMTGVMKTRTDPANVNVQEIDVDQGIEMELDIVRQIVDVEEAARGITETNETILGIVTGPVNVEMTLLTRDDVASERIAGIEGRVRD